MDREIPRKEIVRRKRRKIAKVAVWLLASVVLAYMGLHYIQAGISVSDLETSLVDKGTIEVAVSASGKVVPLFEEVITSPVGSKVLEVYKKPGDSLKVGEPILRLDLAAANADFLKTKNEVEMKRYKLDQQQVVTGSHLSDLRMQVQIAEIKLKRMAVELKNERYLDSIGSSTPDKVRQAELNYSVESLQFEQLKQKYRNERLTSAADLKVSELDYSISKQSFMLMSKTMNDAQVKAPRKSVLTWLNSQIGATVAPGGQLAIVSDLSNFKVEAELSDAYADRIAAGAKAIVRIGKLRLNGIVGNVVPSVKNGIIGFTVMLQESGNARLRSGLKVDIDVVNSIKEGVLRIKNRSYYMGKGDYELWVINQSTAEKRKVKLGECNFEMVEVIDGLKVGDKVIVSDMANYRNRRHLTVRM